MINAESIGKNICAARTQNGFTQKDLATKLAVSPQNVSKWERGLSIPDVMMLLQIAEVLGKDILYFLGNASPAEPVERKAPPVEYEGSVFSNTNWYKQRFTGIKRDKICLNNTIMRYVELTSAAINGCKVEDCEIAHLKCDSTRFTETSVNRCVFRSLKMDHCLVSSCRISASFHGCKVSQSDFDAVVFEGCNLEVTFENCSFRRIALKNCIRSRLCTFKGCRMDNMTAQYFRANNATLIDCSIKEEE